MDSTPKLQPLKFTIGDGTLPRQIEILFYGMKAGDSLKRFIEPDRGWGNHDPNNIHFLPSGDFPDKTLIVPGNVMEFQLPDCQSIAGTIVGTTDEQVEVDFNPPLAGLKLTIDVTILSVAAPC